MKNLFFTGYAHANGENRAFLGRKRFFHWEVLFFSVLWLAGALS